MVSAQAQAHLSIEQVGPETVLPFVEIAFKYGTTAGRETPSYIARDGGYLIRENGNVCAGFTMRKNGNECYVTAAGAASNKADITRAITAALFGIAGVQSVAFQTGRRGLVRKAARIGYRQIGTVHNGVIMRKVIDVGND